MASVVTTIVFNRLPQLESQLRERAGLAVRKAAFDIEAGAKQSMKGPKSGATYKRGSKSHQASAPGEAPAIDTGNLVNSIQTDVQGLRAEVGTAVEYALYLEYGTSKMAARPFLGPAAEAVRPSLIQAMESLLE